jgi:elongation factor G
VTVPEHNMGDIAGDLSARRGRILGTDTLPGNRLQITAQAPLSELQQYSNQLKSVTGGQGSYTMELDHYEPVPPHIQQQLTTAYKPRAEED